MTSGSGSPASAQRSRERLEIAREDRPEIGVDRRRRGALVLAELGRDLVRGDDPRAGQAAPQLVRDRLLVARVAEREEQADGDRLRVDCGQRVEVERPQHAVRPDPLVARRSSARAGRAARDGRRRAGRGAPASWRRRWSRCSKPAVATKAVRAPLRSSSAFVATVVPCVKRSRSCSADRARRPRARTPPAAPEVGTFAVAIRPSSIRTASVNVPPTSTPRMPTRRMYAVRRSVEEEMAARARDRAAGSGRRARRPSPDDRLARRRRPAARTGSTRRRGRSS